MRLLAIHTAAALTCLSLPSYGNQATDVSATPANDAQHLQCSQTQTTPFAADEYPSLKRQPSTQSYFGRKVTTPFAQLENELTSVEYAWLAAEKALTNQFWHARTRLRYWQDLLAAQMTWQRRSAPRHVESRFFSLFNDGADDFDTLRVAADASSIGDIVIDPSLLSQDGTRSLAGISISPTGRFVAYATSDKGSDWQQWHIKDVANKKDLPDQIVHSKFSNAAWTKDENGFYYTRYQRHVECALDTAEDAQPAIYYHILGTQEAQDRQVFVHPNKDFTLEVTTTPDHRLIVVNATPGDDKRNLVYILDTEAKSLGFIPFIDKLRARNAVVASKGSAVYLRTQDGAPRGCVEKHDLYDKKRPPKVIIKQTSDTLLDATWVGGTIVLNYLKDGASLIKIFNERDDTIKTVTLPSLGTAFGFAGHVSDATTFFSFHSFYEPMHVYALSTADASIAPVYRPTIKKIDSSCAYVTRQVFLPSKDGTRISAFISHREDLNQHVPHPTRLYGYGGFGAPVRPGFSEANMLWMQGGGVFVAAITRGGGEYGRLWHQAGMKLKKQNVFDDFIAVARWLIANHVTTSDQLVAEGHSNGGLLMGAMLTQQPSLFGGINASAGVMDMLAFERFTCGRGWAAEYGSTKDKHAFRAMLAYSPLHNVPDKGAFPATLISTGDHDDRVVPSHSYKFAAALQASQSALWPILLDVTSNVGHGAGKSRRHVIEDGAKSLAFAEWASTCRSNAAAH